MARSRGLLRAFGVLAPPVRDALAARCPNVAPKTWLWPLRRAFTSSADLPRDPARQVR